MSRLFYIRPDPVDDEVLSWLESEIRVPELSKRKTAYEILNQDVLPNLRGLIPRLSPDNIAHLINCHILEKYTNELLPLGKGYLYNMIVVLAD